MIDFTPNPRPAPRLAQIWAHARMEAGLILSNGEQLLLSVVIPLSVLLGGRFLGERFAMPFSELAPSVLAMVLWSSGLTTLAISTGFERRYNVLERLAATPLGREGVLLGKSLSILLITVAQLLVLTGLAVVLGWRPDIQPLPTLLAVASGAIGLASFIALGLAIAGSLRPETTLAVANLLFLCGLALGIVIPVAALPDWAWFVQFLPTAAVGEALRAVSSGAVVWLPLVVVSLWALAAAALARKVFKWTS
ncbi:ABC transporter permease [Tessaracoccus sp. OH4464_COT-324]|uniref:ABC transporter permease n=1 Tax=Tessaracoccus sp. OH4464_COT-324 TaxID=2491059 RepID=UPI000F63F309|nr:ABC transporter permease [Tessaracoccus sp. OH4464_COT-324]RRD47714.1 ABC transporter permease [Tessaracoccus sp. OH4464_COT-324]